MWFSRHDPRCNPLLGPSQYRSPNRYQAYTPPPPPSPTWNHKTPSVSGPDDLFCWRVPLTPPDNVIVDLDRPAMTTLGETRRRGGPGQWLNDRSPPRAQERHVMQLDIHTHGFPNTTTPHRVIVGKEDDRSRPALKLIRNCGMLVRNGLGESRSKPLFLSLRPSSSRPRFSIFRENESKSAEAGSVSIVDPEAKAWENTRNPRDVLGFVCCFPAVVGRPVLLLMMMVCLPFVDGCGYIGYPHPSLSDALQVPSPFHSAA